MMKGYVFDIRRFSTHDGDGIRTTVFLKGCPLRCVWCQNPEGLSPQIQPIYFESKCIHCNSCVKLSKEGGVFEKDGRIHIKRDQIDGWFAIANACPANALVLDSKVYEVSELVEELKKDLVFFRRGGGVTLSGGEPLMQGAFAREVLKELQEVGIHTAIETALGVSTSVVESVVPYLDQIYADMKLEDETLHKKYVGTSNVLIKKNLELLLRSPIRDRMVVRTPLIPGMTATRENLTNIARFLSEIEPQVKYELLNYNPLAQAKYHLVGRTYGLEENLRMYTKKEMVEFAEIAREGGLKNIIVES